MRLYMNKLAYGQETMKKYSSGTFTEINRKEKDEITYPESSPHDIKLVSTCSIIHK